MKRLLTLVAGISFVIGYANSQTIWHWSGAIDDDWTKPGNWQEGSVPPESSTEVWLTPVQGGSAVVTIPTGYTASVCKGGQYAIVFGPEWGMTLNIYGSLTYNWYLAPAGIIGGATSVVNVYGSIYGGEGIALGHGWWEIRNVPNVAMNVYPGGSVAINWMWWGGRLYLWGGSFSIAGGVVDSTEGNVSDATRLIDIYEGTLILPNGFTSRVQDWVNRGILKAYGGNGQLVVEEREGRTYVTAIPEPRFFGFLPLAVAGILWLKKRTQTTDSEN